jgi:hypothetical protein
MTYNKTSLLGTRTEEEKKKLARIWKGKAMRGQKRSESFWPMICDREIMSEK